MWTRSRRQNSEMFLRNVTSSELCGCGLRADTVSIGSEFGYFKKVVTKGHHKDMRGKAPGDCLRSCSCHESAQGTLKAWEASPLNTECKGFMRKNVSLTQG